MSPSVAERHQHLDRSQIELVDQHNRTWRAESEVGIDQHRKPRIAPVGAFNPGFVAPYDFYPPAKYLKYDPKKPSFLTIDYVAWKDDVMRAHQDVREQLVRLATKLYKSEAAKYVKHPTEEMLVILYGGGKGPEPVEPIVAAMQGNGWILGTREYDPALPGDKRLKPFLDRWKEIKFNASPLTAPDEVKVDFTEGQEDEELVEKE